MNSWIEIRKVILMRDNYTCQRCKTFNPQLGMVEIVNPENSDIEMHEYESSPAHSQYTISSQMTTITFTLEFGTDWLVLPILQVHHKKYIEGREIWEYEESDLITLCKQCHTDLHLNEEIPVYNSINEFLYYKKFKPEDFSSGRNHNYKPWIFINNQNPKNEYRAAGVTPTVTYLIWQDEEPKEVNRIIDEMIRNFFDKYLPAYKAKYETTYENI